MKYGYKNELVVKIPIFEIKISIFPVLISISNIKYKFGEVIVNYNNLSYIGKKNHILIDTSIGIQKCILCHLCSFSCPTDCLYIGKLKKYGRQKH